MLACPRKMLAASYTKEMSECQTLGDSKSMTFNKGTPFIRHPRKPYTADRIHYETQNTL